MTGGDKASLLYVFIYMRKYIIHYLCSEKKNIYNKNLKNGTPKVISIIVLKMVSTYNAEILRSNI